MFSTGRHCHYDTMVFYIGCIPKIAVLLREAVKNYLADFFR